MMSLLKAVCMKEREEVWRKNTLEVTNYTLRLPLFQRKLGHAKVKEGNLVQSRGVSVEKTIVFKLYNCHVKCK